MSPSDKGERASPYVNRLIRVIRESGVMYELTSMGIVIETETMDDALAMVKTCFDQLEPDCKRIYSSLKFDICKGEPGRMKKKIESIRNKIGEV